ncbi:IclR family transcriptional regulator [Nocardia salmonicida]|uniref:IclR family transcriptional regulator n=1 Tax=Nocardia salmonicida TaxID=53431 RepID=UPI00366BBEBA
MTRLVPALVRAFDILELFLDTDEALTGPQIQRALGLPRTTVHELLATLVARRYLLAESAGRYRLGVRLHQLGSRYGEQLDLAEAGQRVAADIAARCQETVHVAVLEDRDVIYIAKVDSTHTVRMVSAAGRRLPAHCTAVGKMLLASLSEQELRTRLPADTELVAMTAHTLTDTDALYQQLALIRDKGLAVEECESNTDVCCLSAPVHDRTGEVVAALSISVPATRWNRDHREELEKLVTAGARDLSEHLGYRERQP